MIDRFTQLLDIDKAGSLERLAAQNAKPAFNLIESGSASGRKVQMHVGMALEPAVVLGLVGFGKRSSELRAGPGMSFFPTLTRQ